MFKFVNNIIDIMANTIDKYLANMQLVLRNLPNQVESIVKSNSERILDLNRETQLFERGVDSKGQKLQEYAYFTIQIKQLLKQPYDRTTLFYSGQFYDGFTYKFDANTYTLEIFSVDRKTPQLVAKYGGDIFGLDEQNKLYLNQSIIKPQLDQWLLKYL